MANLELNVDPQGVVRGVATAKQALGGVKTSAKQAETALVGVGTKGSAAMARMKSSAAGLGGAMRGARVQIQNTAFQVGDFAVQVGAGTAASVALGQQLPQLLGSFGALGAVLGAVVAIGIPLAAAFFRTGEESEDLEEKLKSLSDAVSVYMGTVDLAISSNKDLADSFGKTGDAIRPTLDFMAESARVAAVEKLNSSLKSLTETFGGLSREKLVSGDLGGIFNNGYVGPVPEILRTMDQLKASLGLTEEEARRVTLALEGLGTAQGVTAQIAAGVQLHETFIDVFGTVENIPPELKTVADATGEAVIEAGRLNKGIEDTVASAEHLASLDIGWRISSAATEAERLADWLGVALSTSLQLLSTTPMMRDEDSLMSQGVLPDSTQRESDRNAVVNFGRLTAPKKKKKGGRASEIDKEQRAVERLRESYNSLLGSMDDIVAAQNTYEDSLKMLNEALAKGVISQKEFDSALVQITDRLEEAKLSATDARDNFSSFFTSILTGAKSAKEALADLFMQIANRELTAAFNGLFAGIMGGGGSGAGFLNFLFSANGNAFSGGNVIPFAKGGVVNAPTFFPLKGQTGVMGEAGPEAVMPLKRGADGKLGVSAGGGSSSNSTKIINVMDPRIVGDYLSTYEGENLIMNVMSRNRGTLVA